MQSSRWQAPAALPEVEREERIAIAKMADRRNAKNGPAIGGAKVQMMLAIRALCGLGNQEKSRGPDDLTNRW